MVYKVKAHCHYTGKYNAAHNICNLRYRIPKEISVVLSYWFYIRLPFYNQGVSKGI